MKNTALLLCLSLLLVSASCHNGVQFDAKWMVGDHKGEQLIDETGVVVACVEPDFDKYACLHEDDLARLIDILSRARLPKDEKNWALDFLTKGIK